ncbi:MAG: hypothetical protein SGI92_20365 [Bryobacteraceae bacterium]|nr:hypothetical protein [Bryobacteraceae bacterium]
MRHFSARRLAHQFLERGLKWDRRFRHDLTLRGRRQRDAQVLFQSFGKFSSAMLLGIVISDLYRAGLFRYHGYVATGLLLTGVDDFYTMANLSPKRTGLPFVVWISPKAGAKHDIRVKVSPGPKAKSEDLISVALRPEVRVVDGELSPQDLARLREWVALNLDVLVRFWDGQIEYTEEVIEALRAL